MSEPNAPKKRIPILVVDENAFNRAIVSDILRSAGFDHLLYGKDGQELMALTEQMAPKIVIANSRLPKMSGLEFTRAVRAGREGVNRSLSIIIATNTATTKFLEAARASGVDEMLTRPFTAAALLARVEAVLIRPRRFIEGMNYVGPCRRRRMLDDYGGPMRRLSDPIEEAGDAPWEMGPNRDLVRICVDKVAALAVSGGGSQDRRWLRAFFEAAEDAEQLAEDVRDTMLAQAARSLTRYITAMGANQALDEDVVSTHVDALQKLRVLSRSDFAEREKLLAGLKAVVDKKLGRARAAA